MWTVSSVPLRCCAAASDASFASAQEVAIEVLMLAGYTDPEMADLVGVPVGDGAEPLLVEALLRAPALRAMFDRLLDHALGGVVGPS